MTGEKRTETRMRCYNTLCIPYISLHPSLQLYTMHACREGRGVIYREYTECYSISFLFLFFFHQSSLYPIKIFAKCFYLLVRKMGSHSFAVPASLFSIHYYNNRCILITLKAFGLKRSGVSDSHFVEGTPSRSFRPIFCQVPEFGIPLIFVHPLLRPTANCNA